MRVLICTGIFPPEKGGPATYSKILAEELAKKRHEVRVITYGNAEFRMQNSEFRIPVIKVRRSFFKPWHYFKYYRAVKKYGKDADILYAQGPVSEGYPTYLANKSLKKPFVVKITGDYSWEQAYSRGLTRQLIDEFQSLNSYPAQIKKMREIQKLVCTQADLIITPSKYLKKIVAGWGIQEDKIRVIYNAVEIPEARPVPKPADEFLIVSAGRDVPWKGFNLLREVVEELRSGSTSSPTNLPPELSRRLKLEILHSAPREEFLNKLSSADLFVLNTGYEGFPHSILEAMAMGIPVIASSVGGNPEIIDQPLQFDLSPPLGTLSRPGEGKGEVETTKVNGILVEYNNKEQLKAAILKLYQDKNLRDQFIENGKAAVQKFSLEKMINQTEGMLSQCAS